jgi:2-methylaconitate cis-trans-isomerase PrpF
MIPVTAGTTSAVVGPFALLRGLIHPVEPVPKVQIYNTNTKKVILAEFLVENGEFISEEIFGLMALQAAAPRSFSISSARESVTGKLLPTGKVREEVKFPKLGTLEVSMADAATPLYSSVPETWGSRAMRTSTNSATTKPH